MNNWLKSTLGLSAAAAFVLFAQYGKPFVVALDGAFRFLFKLAADAPLGASSFALALALAVGVQPLLYTAMKQLRCPESRDFLVMAAALVVAVAVMWIQLHTLQGLLLGLLAGFAAPHVFKGITALIRLARPKPTAGEPPAS